MHFDSTLTLSTLILLAGQVVVVVSLWTAFRTKVDLLLASHAQLMQALGVRFDRHEESDDKRFERIDSRIMDLLEGLGRSLGHADAFRTTPRDHS